MTAQPLSVVPSVVEGPFLRCRAMCRWRGGPSTTLGTTRKLCPALMGQRNMRMSRRLLHQLLDLLAMAAQHRQHLVSEVLQPLVVAALGVGLVEVEVLV